MLNEEKVRYMTELAIFEKNQGKKIFPVNRFFKSDYVGGHMFRSFFGFTFSYLLILLLWGLYNLDRILGGTEAQQMILWAKNWGIAYIAGLSVYLLITRLVYARKYDLASRTQTVYAARLSHLLKSYSKDRPERSQRVRGGREV